jgi:hypothetical protein
VLTVSRADGVVGLEKLSSHIDRLNALSDRPNPFASAAFLRCYAAWAEYHVPGREESLYSVRDENQAMVGIAPMRRSIENLTAGVGPLRLRGVRLQVLAPLDTESPGILAAPPDVSRVAAALIEHWRLRERDWGLLEFAGQVRGSPLYTAMHDASVGAFRARDVDVEPYTEIGIIWKDLADYFRSLSKKMRSNIGRQARRLVAHGRVEVVLAEGPDAAGAWFGAYCDLDGRSWKHATESSIRRHPRRVRFYEEIASGRGGLDPSFIGILLDGVLIAGLLVGSNASAAADNHGAWCLEMAYDQSRADLGPGQLLLLLAVGEALRRGDRFVNFMQNFAYYKHRWGATLQPVVNVQLLRRRSLHNLRASIAQWTRRRASRPQTSDAGLTQAGHCAESEVPRREPAMPACGDVTLMRARTSAALAYTGPGIRVLNREQLRTYLPFDIEKA